MKKVLPYCFIALLALSLVACKNTGNESAQNPAAATTPLEGIWNENGLTAPMSTVYKFTGSNIVCTATGLPCRAYIADPANATMDLNVSLTATGTFRLDGNNIHVKITSISAKEDTTDIDGAAYMASTGNSFIVLNTEKPWGTYAINGNTLTITPPNPPGGSAQTFTKQ